MTAGTRKPAANAVLKVPLSKAELAATKQTVCVTGAAGYIAAHILQRLLAAGHTVHAAVRSASKLGPLVRLPGAAERLRVFQGCDLTVPGSFDRAIQDCVCVIHTASPFALNVKKHLVKKHLLEPAVEGTRNVLASVAKTPSVRRVVLTSSIVALFSWPEPGVVYDESCWNKQASEDEYAYELSKTLAEKAAWDIVGEQERWDLVTINPALVFGPPLLEDHSDAQSVHVMRRMLRGDMAPGYPDYNLKMVDVRDVARAHCLAMVTPSASGRYLLAPHDFTFGRVRQVIARGPLGRSWNVWLRLPSKPLWCWLLWLLADLINIERYRLESTYGVPLRTNGTKVERELGLRDWIADADTYEEMAETMVALGMVNWLRPNVGPNAIVPFPPTKPPPERLFMPLW
ncbi:diaminohydroxyphosphoribosylaminopyrimidine deaminase [Raphidocelis subcapitata]|uniref:Diaminohydroxyphosphoribosylaminopyrimidine deaminase n=1 Tax=Raphidocelis subcapitata TaxID=307507 RepID=A0A2V0PIZ6_9CHLO|nr:diaminohydroxyphosphoribosylaminopyrimidine deaminase [Raphidocelis subcapitata]|eukprot:GBF99784.1 diaminohydroxyphosphoribosylaminopyrimidine deaminase [Raphidocelis subcapitata]